MKKKQFIKIDTTFGSSESDQEPDTDKNKRRWGMGGFPFFSAPIILFSSSL
jgi:hypothetical protein